MTDYLLLFWIFFKTGLFTVGGGMAMIPLVQQELVERGYITLAQSIDMIAISQMTPGPFAVNCATFAGFNLAGIPGAVIATLGIVLPSMILCLLVARFFFRFCDNQIVKSVLSGIKPVVLALILSGLFSVFRSAILPALAFSAIDLPVLGIALVLSLLMVKTKISPALLVLLSGAFGAVFLRS